jgi:Na+/phosphate symporter
MDAKQEQKSLQENPLPVTIGTVIDYVTNCPADKVLTSITRIDDEIDTIQQAVQPYLTALQMQRNVLLERAKMERIMEDSHALLIEVKGKQMRNEISDLDTFKLQFPDGFAAIRKQQESDLTDKYQKNLRELADAKVPLTLADKKIGKEAVTAFVGYQPVTITYEVRKRGSE